MAYELIETIEVGAGGAASIEFTSIPQDGVDLVLVTSLRSSTTSNAAFLVLNDASVTGKYLYGSGSVADSYTSGWGLMSTPSSATANTPSSTGTYISNYTSATAHSVSVDAVTENNATAVTMTLNAGISTSTTAVTNLKINAAVTFVQYSTASLYKIY